MVYGESFFDRPVPERVLNLVGISVKAFTLLRDSALGAFRSRETDSSARNNDSKRSALLERVSVGIRRSGTVPCAHLSHRSGVVSDRSVSTALHRV